jgi:pimeloyl-ACP methyl ester carboxylesterase
MRFIPDNKRLIVEEVEELGLEPVNEKTLESLWTSPSLKHGKKRGNELVILFHGWMSGASTLKELEAHLRNNCGFSTFSLDYSATLGTYEGILTEVETQLRSINFGAEFKKVHIVAHSMGGLVAWIFLSRHKLENGGRFVPLGSPFLGSNLVNVIRFNTVLLSKTSLIKNYEKLLELVKSSPKKNPNIQIGLVAGSKTYTIRDLGHKGFDFRRGIFTSINDGTVEVDSAFGAEANERTLLHVNHYQLITLPEVFDEIESFLVTGHFSDPVDDW